MSVQSIPEPYHTLTPYLVVPDADAAIAFYAQAFQAVEQMRLVMPDGRLGHAELKIGTSMMMLSSAWPESGVHAPDHYGGTPVSLFLYTENCEAMFVQAVAAGAIEVQAPSKMFWGDVMARVTDPFGHHWSMATHVEDVSPEEVRQRMLAQYGR